MQLTGNADQGWCLIPDWPAPEKVVALSTTRLGGHSKKPYHDFNLASHVGDDTDTVARNRGQLQSCLDSDIGLQWLQQVHGDHVVTANRVRSEPPVADAIFTRVPGIACCVATADCLPVLFASADGREIAAAHAGWRGLAAGILERTIDKFSNLPDNLLAWMGPAIGPCHFEVGGEVKDRFLCGETIADQQSILNCFTPGAGPDKWMADLYQLARLRLKNMGIKQIFGGEFCTYCDASRFYSHRRGNPTGRMVSLIYINPSK